MKEHKRQKNIQQPAPKGEGSFMADKRLKTGALLQLQHTMRHSPRNWQALQLQASIQAHTLQRAASAGEEEKSLQAEPIQKNETLAQPGDNNTSAGSVQAIQRKPATENNTGLPDTLKSGIENLSGYSMNDVQVHYNSPAPAQLQAHAYAQGTDIHVAPGQEQHLPHEAWHVVQQKQGRVQPTARLKENVVTDLLPSVVQGVFINTGGFSWQDQDTGKTYQQIEVRVDNRLKVAGHGEEFYIEYAKGKWERKVELSPAQRFVSLIKQKGLVIVGELHAPETREEETQKWAERGIEVQYESDAIATIDETSVRPDPTLLRLLYYIEDFSNVLSSWLKDRSETNYQVMDMLYNRAIREKDLVGMSEAEQGIIYKGERFFTHEDIMNGIRMMYDALVWVDDVKVGTENKQWPKIKEYLMNLDDKLEAIKEKVSIVIEEGVLVSRVIRSEMMYSLLQGVTPKNPTIYKVGDNHIGDIIKILQKQEVQPSGIFSKEVYSKIFATL